MMKEAAELGQALYGLGLRLGEMGTVAVGSGGGSLARMMARLVGCGVALAGGEVKFHDGSCAACGAWLRKRYELPVSVFIRQEKDQVKIYLLDARQDRVDPVGTVRLSGGVEEWDLLAGADCAWAADRAGGRRRRGAVCAQGPAALTLTLERLGYEVMDRPLPGVPVFCTDREGFRLQVEQGGTVSFPAGEDALSAAAGFDGWAGEERPEAVPAFRPESDGAQNK